MTTPFFIQASDGIDISLTWFAASRPRCALLMLPALGIQARLYDRLGQALAERGCSVCLLEQRGHGLSPVRASRSMAFGLADFLDKDIPAALTWLGNTAVGLPLVLGGHSLGGHVSTIHAGQHPGSISGIVHVACGFPYHRDFPPRQARLIRMLCRIIPWLGIFPGYFPGNLLGFGGRESVQLMKEWHQWASSGSFDFGQRKNLGQAVASFQGPVISVCLDHDTFNSEAATDRALSPFCNAAVSRIMLEAAEQGDFTGHSNWARQPVGVVQALLEWMEKEVIHENPAIQGSLTRERSLSQAGHFQHDE